VSEQRWTKPRPDGKPHNGRNSVLCAHCEHIYPCWDYIAVLLHCRETHREFYRRKWETEIVPSGQHTRMAGYAPIPESIA
jgi:nuclear transport factor 2 (NTF2) superfamily protein